MKNLENPVSHGYYQRYLYEAPVKSMPNLSSRSPYRTRGDAFCSHCGVFVWEEALHLIHGVWRHKKCNRIVRFSPVPSRTRSWLKRLERVRKEYDSERERVKP